LKLLNQSVLERVLDECVDGVFFLLEQEAQQAHQFKGKRYLRCHRNLLYL